jgi:drug/metabolite transporter (DMT)-like permease
MNERAGLGRDVGWLLFLAAIWGSSYASINVAVAEIPPMTLVAVRAILALAVLFPILLWRGGRLPRDAKSWRLAFVLGAVGLALPFFLIGWAQERIESGQAAILIAVMPLATMVLAHFFTQGDRFSPGKLVGVVLGFVGIVVMVGPEALKGGGGDVLRQLAMAGAAMGYAINAVVTRNLPRGGGKAPMIGRAVMVISASTMITVPLALIIDGPGALFNASVDAWAVTLYLGLVPTGIGTLIYFHLIEARGATFFAFVNYLNPMFGVFFGALLLGEVITVQAGAALGLILAGITVSNWRR